MVYLFMADGMEEVEGLTVVDILRRAGVELQTVSIMGRRNVISSHKIEIMSDILFEDIKEPAEMLVLPGGIPGIPCQYGFCGRRYSVHFNRQTD